MSVLNTYEEMLNDLLKDLHEITVATMIQSGIDPQSDLAKSVKYVQIKDGIAMETAYYYPYVSQGRKRNTRKVPISALIEYMKQYNIRPRAGQTINQLAFAIQTSIYKNGIKAKNFEDKVENAAGEMTQVAVADVLADAIANDLVDMFTPISN